MKITRLKRGYRLRLSDSEFDALEFLVNHGQADWGTVSTEEYTTMPPAVRRVLDFGRLSEIGWARIDEDRRKVPRPARLCSRCGLHEGEYMACEEPECGELIERPGEVERVP